MTTTHTNTTRGTQLTAAPDLVAALFVNGKLLADIQIGGRRIVALSVWDVIGELDAYDFPLVLGDYCIDRTALLEGAARAIHLEEHTGRGTYFVEARRFLVAGVFADEGYLDTARLLGWDEDDEDDDWDSREDGS